MAIPFRGKEKALKILPFGEVCKNDLDECYEGIIDINGVEVEIDLNFESSSCEDKQLSSIVDIISRLPNLANLAWKEISDDWGLAEESKIVRCYLEHHLEYMSQDKILSLFGKLDIDKRAFIDGLSLERIGLYPENKEILSIFDIQFSPDITNYLISVSFNHNDQCTGMALES